MSSGAATRQGGRAILYARQNTHPGEAQEWLNRAVSARPCIWRRSFGTFEKRAEAAETSPAQPLGRSPSLREPPQMIVHLIDGTYELFRHFYGIRRARGVAAPLSAVGGVLYTVAQML